MLFGHICSDFCFRCVWSCFVLEIQEDFWIPWFQSLFLPSLHLWLPSSYDSTQDCSWYPSNTCLFLLLLFRVVLLAFYCVFASGLSSILVLIEFLWIWVELRVPISSICGLDLSLFLILDLEFSLLLYWWTAFVFGGEKFRGFHVHQFLRFLSVLVSDFGFLFLLPIWYNLYPRRENDVKVVSVAYWMEKAWFMVERNCKELSLNLLSLLCICIKLLFLFTAASF